MDDPNIENRMLYPTTSAMILLDSDLPDVLGPQDALHFVVERLGDGEDHPL